MIILSQKSFPVCWLVALLLNIFSSGYCKICSNFSSESSDFSDKSSPFPKVYGTEISCPRPQDPEDYTECCPDSFSCCFPWTNAVHRPTLLQINEDVIPIIAVTVICTCLTVTVLVVVCCFWSRCPLYNACRVNYTDRGPVAYTKDDSPNLNVPFDDPRQNSFSPNSVKIKPIEDV